MLSSRGCQDDQNAKRDPQESPPTIYKRPQRIETLGSTMCLPRGDRTQPQRPVTARQAHGWAPRVLVQILHVDLQRL
jgi:hypothetical protein